LLKLVLQNLILNIVEHKTGFYRGDLRSNDRSSLRSFPLLAGTIFRPDSALPEAVESATVADSSPWRWATLKKEKVG
jgi:hypothetical protein